MVPLKYRSSVPAHASFVPKHKPLRFADTPAALSVNITMSCGDYITDL
jgi:hypothetical protein